jgi:hypothetical protein
MLLSCGKNVFAAGHELEPPLKRVCTAKRHFCPYCPYSTVHSHHLKSHIEMHAGEKKYACDVEGCDYRTNRKHDLTLHNRRNHTGERPFICLIPGCVYAAVCLVDLKRHQRAKHPLLAIEGPGERKVSCLYCDFKGVNDGIVLSHRRQAHPETLQPIPAMQEAVLQADELPVATDAIDDFLKLIEGTEVCQSPFLDGLDFSPAELAAFLAGELV